MLQMHVSLHVNYASIVMICLQMIVWLRLSGGNLDKSTKEACYKNTLCPFAQVLSRCSPRINRICICGSPVENEQHQCLQSPISQNFY